MLCERLRGSGGDAEYGGCPWDSADLYETQQAAARARVSKRAKESNLQPAVARRVEKGNASERECWCRLTTRWRRLW